MSLDKVSNVVCEPSTIAPEETATCTADPYSVTAADVEAGAVDNIATAAAMTVNGADVTSEPATCSVDSGWRCSASH